MLVFQGWTRAWTVAWTPHPPGGWVQRGGGLAWWLKGCREGKARPTNTGNSATLSVKVYWNERRNRRPEKGVSVLPHVGEIYAYFSNSIDKAFGPVKGGLRRNRP